MAKRETAISFLCVGVRRLVFLFLVVCVALGEGSMEGDEEANPGRNPREEEEAVYQHQPEPGFVVRRYWKSLLFWPLLVLVLVLAATLPPVLVGRSDTRDEEKERALMELTKAGTGLRNGVYTAFVPAASLALWVKTRPRLQDQIDGRPVGSTVWGQPYPPPPFK